jgi:hypothetical protein
LPETPLKALARLNGEAARDVERLAAELTPASAELGLLPLSLSDPWTHRHPLAAARHNASEMVERLLVFLDAIEGNPDLEGDDDPGDGK